ncbi:sigma-70 family RNA polymerase sigma factor [Occallatibacter riparius]|uniref:Sigma-70 family RNA polymerase sigma factor n=1 Tax=Occallatibacter riparius TaxID=1002689 RepID=A0A9J7BQY2_9BACT|nr:sigma-70 family RNA polymerase sigma factor [Occallatibacter riparius]UWZ83493.1 sigma-70 family RNA polymerase sigma factor [Occallatibacter riparius]
METSTLTLPDGPLDARYRAFLETLSTIRPALHRYCARMTGSVMDGEDIVQDALFDAYRKLETFDVSRPVSPWLFRIAHNRCVDFLRRRGVRMESESLVAAEPALVEPELPLGNAVKIAVEHLVIHLPPMERACVLLKEVFEYSLQETAELTGSTIAGVKAAIHRGRAKLAQMSEPTFKRREADQELRRLLDLYVKCFNDRDWSGLHELITADARLQVDDRFVGPLANASYFGVYERMKVPWSMAVGEADGELVVICRRWIQESWVPDSLIRVQREGSKISRVIDYLHCPWVFAAAESISIAEQPQ